jgi:hypothetical protein
MNWTGLSFSSGLPHDVRHISCQDNVSTGKVNILVKGTLQTKQ